MSSTKWNSSLRLGNLAPGKITESVSKMKVIVQQTNDVITVVENAMTLIAKLLSSPTDIMAIFMKTVSSVFKVAMKDTLSLGGSLIVIHPYNRMNLREVDVSLDEDHPIYMKAMSPKEALMEFSASFDNESDPYRPLWSDNTYATGMGYLITAPNPVAFVKIISAFRSIFDISELSPIIDGYMSKMNEIQAEANKNQENVNIEYGIDGLKKAYGVEKKIGSKIKVYPYLVADRELPRLHWYGLSINNIKFLKTLVNELEKAMDIMTKVTEENQKAVTDLFNAILKRITAVRELLQTILDACETILVSLDNTGVYSFTVDKGLGGTKYVIDSINSSLANPDTPEAKAVADALATTDFSALFFMGASTGINFSAWEQMLKESLAGVDSLFEEDALDYVVIPDFNDTVFFRDDVVSLSVISAESTDDHPFYFTYTMLDDEGKVISSFTGKNIYGNIATVNKKAFDIKLPLTAETIDKETITKKYTLSVEVTDFNSTYTSEYSFSVTNVFDSITTTLTDGDGLTGEKPVENDGSQPATGGTATIYNEYGSIVDSVGITDGGFSLGSNLTSTDTNLTMVISDGINPDMRLKVSNSKGMYLIIFNTAEELYQSPTISVKKEPAGLWLKFGDAIKIRLIGGEWKMYTIPSIIPITLGNYEYMIYSKGEWSGNYFFGAKTSSTNTRVC